MPRLDAPNAEVTLKTWRQDSDISASLLANGVPGIEVPLEWPRGRQLLRIAHCLSVPRPVTRYRSKPLEGDDARMPAPNLAMDPPPCPLGLVHYNFGRLGRVGQPDKKHSTSRS